MVGYFLIYLIDSVHDLSYANSVPQVMGQMAAQEYRTDPNSEMVQLFGIAKTQIIPQPN